MNKVVPIILAVLITAAVFGAGGYYLGARTNVPDSSEIDILTATGTIPPSTSATSGSNMLDYASKDLGFSFKFPSNFSLIEEFMGEGGPAVSLSFGKNKSEGISNSIFLKINADKGAKTIDQLSQETRESIGQDLIGNVTELNIDGQKAFKYQIGGIASGFKVVTAKGDINVVMDLYPDMEESTTFMNNVIKTFKF